jgi:D-lyxose ketol-isomerase
MKRSRINGLIDSSIAFMAQMRFHLPPWAFWSPAQWRGRSDQAREIIRNMLGWDLTDFGGGEFEARGLILFTIRNGNPQADAKPYAEKAMIVQENQETPWHFHWKKMEDIINRGGGNLVLEIYGSTAEGGFAHDPVDLRVDGLRRSVEPGGRVVLTPGESICLEPGVYHRFYAEKGRGAVLAGEVSGVNDDLTDNRFHEPQGRFPSIEEDEEPRFLLVTDYPRYL